MIILHADGKTYPVNHCCPVVDLSLDRDEEIQLKSKVEYIDDSLNRKVSDTHRRVHFSGRNTIHPVPRLSTFSLDERRRCWITADDMCRIHSNNRMLVAKTLKGETIDIDKDSIRGLENQLRGNKPSRRHQESIVVVLETQDEFWEDEDGHDELSETIFLLYRPISEESASEAASIGLQDERKAYNSLFEYNTCS